MIITFTLQSTTDGSLLTGQASNTTVYISKDFGTYAQSTNSVTEIGRGEYKLELTTAESTYTTELHYQPVCTGAMTNTYAVGKDVESVTPAEIWSYSGGRTVTNTIPTVSEIQSGLAKTTDLDSLSTFDPSSDTVTVNSTQASTFATASELAKCYGSMCHWSVSGTTLTTKNSDGSTLQTFTLTKDTSGNITAIEEAS